MTGQMQLAGLPTHSLDYNILALVHS